MGEISSSLLSNNTIVILFVIIANNFSGILYITSNNDKIFGS